MLEIAVFDRPMDNDRTAAARRRILELATARGESLSALSRALRRNVSYLHQHIYRGSPKRLEEDDRLFLAMHFNVDERELGARDPWAPQALRCCGGRGLA